MSFQRGGRVDHVLDRMHRYDIIRSTRYDIIRRSRKYLLWFMKNKILHTKCVNRFFD